MPTLPPKDAEGTVKRGRFVAAGEVVCVPDETRDAIPAHASHAGPLQTAGPRPRSLTDTPPPIRCLGAMVPGYVMGTELARGGMGVVLAARDVVLDREVAIKMLLSGAADNAVAVRRFMDEARITARLAHPCVPPVYALGTLADGRPYLAMKLIRGRTLAAVLTARELRPSSPGDEELEQTAFHAPGLLQVFEQICQGVAFAHSQGIIHRDLKPANVMVGAFGEVQVMDWGLARELKRGADSREHKTLREGTPVAPTTETLGHADDTERSRVGEALGTPAYMPPEQARGDWDRVDARADVFALGGILCAILTGKPPFAGRTVVEVVGQAVAADLGETFARLDACGADHALIKLAKWCLAPHPRDRPADASAVTAILHAHRFDTEEREQVEHASRVKTARYDRPAAPKPGTRRPAGRSWAAATISAALALVGHSTGGRGLRAEMCDLPEAIECDEPTLSRS